jgi:hypothetical protein
MGVFGIASSILGQIASATNQNPNKQQIKQGFQLLGQDLQSGNMSQAQSDFSSLQQLLPSGQQSSLLSPASGAQSGSPLATVSQLAQDLKSGNTAATQSDLATVQQDVQQLGQQRGAGHAHHHHHHGGESSQSSSEHNAPSTLFGQLGQQLQAGNLSGAQQAYSTMQQGFQQFALNNSSSSSGAPSAASGASLSVSA